MSAASDDTHDNTAQLTALLEEAEEAHGVYETNELDGVYDEAWAIWYARYAVDNGIGALVGRDLTSEELASYLMTSFADFTAASPADESWAAYTGRRILAEL